MTREELAELGIEDPGHLEEQQAFVTTWNELIYSGAADGKGTQAQFVHSMLARGFRG